MWGGKTFLEIVEELLETNRGKVLGAIIGLSAGLLIMKFGFWKTVFIVLCILLGFYLGKRFDEGGSFGDWWDRFFGER